MPASSACALMLRIAIDDMTPIKPPMTKSHIVKENPLGITQLRQNPPPEGWFAVPATFIDTDWLLGAAWLLGSVAVKLTTNVRPAWLWVGVNEKAPVDGLKDMLGAKPVAVTFTVSAGMSGFFA
jgi:hypothetical protein